MNTSELIEQLAELKSSEQRVEVLTSRLLKGMPRKLKYILVAASVPHWFDHETLYFLTDPEYEEDFEGIFSRLIDLSVVQLLSNNVYCIEETTRKFALDELWSSDPDKFKDFSGRAAEYFSKGKDTKSKIEWLYHLVVSDPDRGAEALHEIGSSWNNTLRFDDLETLVDVLFEQVELDRVPASIKSLIYYRKGKLALHFNAADLALKTLKKAKELSNSSSEDYISIMQAIGDAQKISGNHNQALESYQRCLTLSQGIQDSLNRALTSANALESIGDIQLHGKQFKEALKNYRSALKLFEDVKDALGKANVLQAIAEIYQNLGAYGKAIKNANQALNIYRSIKYPLGEASTLFLRANIYNLQKEKKTAIDSYKEAYASFEALGLEELCQTIKSQIDHISDPVPTPPPQLSRLPEKTEFYLGYFADIIQKPIISEKALIHLENNKYVFDVSKKATKPEIKCAIESLFEVKVVRVNTHIPPRKIRRVGKSKGFKPQYKRAIVTLAKGDSIVLFPEI